MLSEFLVLVKVLGLLFVYLSGPVVIITVGGSLLLQKLFRFPLAQRMPPLSRVELIAFGIPTAASLAAWGWRLWRLL